MIIAPVFASLLLGRGAKEWHNPLMLWLTSHYRTAVRKAIEHRYVTVGFAGVLSLFSRYLTFGGPIGSEFLPHLDEGSIWVRERYHQVRGRRRAFISPTRPGSLWHHFPKSHRL